MSNTHGHLLKAERAQLPAELQQRLAAWTTKAYTDENLFLPWHAVRACWSCFCTGRPSCTPVSPASSRPPWNCAAFAWRHTITVCIEVWRAAHR